MQQNDLISVLVADDHMVVRRGLGLVVEDAPDFALAGMAESGEEAMHLCHKLRPDVVLMDVMMAGMGGVEAARLIAQHHRETRVIALSSSASGDAVSAMLEAGASAYLLKDVSAEELVDTIRRVNAGEVIATPTPPADDLQPATPSPSPAQSEQDFELGAQQIRVLTLMAKGFTNPEIAKHLGVSRPTVSYHVSAILRKLDVSNRSEAVAVAVQHNLTDPSGI